MLSPLLTRRSSRSSPGNNPSDQTALPVFDDVIVSSRARHSLLNLYPGLGPRREVKVLTWIRPIRELSCVKGCSLGNPLC
ncbi:unnamed protein product [Caenorhabditis nigoni]